MSAFEVEVQRTISTTTTVHAETAADAAGIVNKRDYPLPSENEWEIIGGWLYIVRAPETGEELYEGDGTDQS